MGSVYQVPFTGGSGYPSQSYLKTSGLRVWRYDFRNTVQYVGVMERAVASNVDGVLLAPYIRSGSTEQHPKFGFIVGSQNRFLYADLEVNTGGGTGADGSYNSWIPTGDQASANLPYSNLVVVDAYGNGTSQQSLYNLTFLLDPYLSLEDAKAAISSYVPGSPISYRLMNCTAPDAPERAVSGSPVSVTLTANSGYTFLNPSSDIYVTNNGVAVVSSYANGVLHFTMP